jgi:DNA primase
MSDLFDRPDEEVWADYAIVKNQVSVEALLSHYGLAFKPKGNDFKLGCPFHASSSSDSLGIHRETGKFQCWSPTCKAKGNVLDLVAHLENCSVSQAAVRIAKLQRIPALLLKEQGNIAAQAKRLVKAARPEPKNATPLPAQNAAPQTVIPKAKLPVVINPPLSFKLKVKTLAYPQGVDREHFYGQRRGLTRQTVDTYDGGLCQVGYFAGHYVLGLHNVEGELIGYVGRNLNDAGEKYKLPSSEKGFLKTHVVFNLHAARQYAGGERAVILVENPFVCLWLTQMDFPCVALLGSSMSDIQVKLLTTYFRRYLLFLDGDEAGRAGTEKVAGQLVWHGSVQALTLADDEQPDDLSEEQIWQRIKSL